MILIRFWGGMGNQMFQYAAARALAAKHNTIVKMDTDLITNFDPHNTVFKFYYELGGFKIKSNIATSYDKKKFLSSNCNIVERIFYKVGRLFNPKMYYRQSDIYSNDFWDIKDNTCIEGRFQSENYFKPFEDIIRKEFEFNISLPDYVKPLETKINSSNAIGIQVRRGIIKTPHYYKIMGAMEPEYYQKGIDIITEKQKNVEIFVISDDIEWCKENLKFSYPTTFLTDDIASNNHHVQLYLLSCCKHFVIPNSSFAWWGAWLSSNKDKVVVAPKTWFLDKSYHGEDTVPDSWIKI